MPIQTLSYGYKQPQNDDGGDLFFPAMQSNIQQLNDHVHDGLTSALIPTVSQAISHTTWVAVVGVPGLYSQVVTMPTGLLFAKVVIQLRDSTGNVVENQIDAATSNTYTVFTNDNTLDLVAEYAS